MSTIFMHFPNKYQETAEIILERLYQDKEDMLKRKIFPKDSDFETLTLKISFSGSSVTFFGTNDDFSRLFESIGNGLDMVEKTYYQDME